MIKTQIQTFDLTQPDLLSLKRGRGRTNAHDYKYNAALNTLDGKVLSITAPTLSASGVVEVFLKIIDYKILKTKGLHLIVVDSYVTRKHSGQGLVS